MSLILDHEDFPSLAADFSGLIAADPLLLSRLDQYEQVVARIGDIAGFVFEQLLPEPAGISAGGRTSPQTFIWGSPWRPDQPWLWFDQGLFAWHPPFPAVRASDRRALAVGSPSFMSYSMHVYDAQGGFRGWLLAPRNKSLQQKIRHSNAARRDLSVGGSFPAIPPGASFLAFHKYRFEVQGVDRGEMAITVLNNLHVMEAVLSVVSFTGSKQLKEAIDLFDPRQFGRWLELGTPATAFCGLALNDLAEMSFDSSGDLTRKLDSLLSSLYLERMRGVMTDCLAPYFQHEGLGLVSQWFIGSIPGATFELLVYWTAGGKAAIILAVVNGVNKTAPVMISYFSPSAVATYRLTWVQTSQGLGLASATPAPELSPPTADFTVSFQSQAQVRFDGSISTTGPGRDSTPDRGVSYQWQFGDGQSGAGPEVVHSFSQPGIYDVRLQVTDSQGRANSTVRRITVSEQGRPPVIQSLQCSMHSTSPIQVQVTASVTDPDGDLQSLSWYRSPSSPEPLFVTAPSNQSQLISFSQPQSIYSPMLRATDQAGNVTTRICATDGSPPGTFMPLNDTGQDWCANNSTGNLSCPQTGFPRQDGDHGRDALARQGQLTKIGAGAAGFDYTKISNSGNPLPASAALGPGPNDWACTRDNVTGLVWEVKVNNASHLRHMDHTYTWYSTDASVNGGVPGSLGSATSCNSTLAQCNTQAFVAAVNAQGLCGHGDWRMPTPQELQGIVHYGLIDPAIDPTFFANTPFSGHASWVWSSRPFAIYASVGHSLWKVNFSRGHVHGAGSSFDCSVRLVRAGQ